jgi:hypothetical protein
VRPNSNSTTANSTPLQSTTDQGNFPPETIKYTSKELFNTSKADKDISAKTYLFSLHSVTSEAVFTSKNLFNTSKACKDIPSKTCLFCLQSVTSEAILTSKSLTSYSCLQRLTEEGKITFKAHPATSRPRL